LLLRLFFNDRSFDDHFNRDETFNDQATSTRTTNRWANGNAPWRANWNALWCAHGGGRPTARLALHLMRPPTSRCRTDAQERCQCDHERPLTDTSDLTIHDLFDSSTVELWITCEGIWMGVGWCMVP
jgi:hypothetical protein